MGYGFGYGIEDDNVEEEAEGQQDPLGFHMGWPYYKSEKESEEAMNETIACTHEYVNVGFYTITKACRFCGKEEIG